MHSLPANCTVDQLNRQSSQSNQGGHPGWKGGTCVDLGTPCGGNDPLLGNVGGFLCGLFGISSDSDNGFGPSAPNPRANANKSAVKAGQAGGLLLALVPGADSDGAAAELGAGDAGDGSATDLGHAGIHQSPGVTAGKSQFFDGEDLSVLSNTNGSIGVLQKNGNTRFVLHWSHDIGVDRTTGLPTNVYTVVRKPDGSVLTMFPGTSPKS
jgi:hypothetical protein